MKEEKLIGVVAKSRDSGESDKLITLITACGIKTAIMRGVKKPNAKLKPLSVPFAFGEYILVSKGASNIVTSASIIEDLFLITRSTEDFVAASIIAEVSLYTFLDEENEKFVFMLRCLKDIICGNAHAYISAIKYIQYVIHSSGYAYEYERYEGDIDSPIKLLSAISLNRTDYVKGTDEQIIKSTLIKLVKNLEKKIEKRIHSAAMVI